MLNQFKKTLTYLILLAFVLVAFTAFYTWATLNWVYSSGERAGYVQKLSQKGWVCKTYEGELILVSMPGTQAEKFFFTVRDESVVKKINTSIGERVRLIYEEHKGVPSTCFGETSFYVKDVKILNEIKLSN